MKTVCSVLGTRPEIIKFSPLLPELDRAFHHLIVHTGQHYDEKMDGAFFRELELRRPDFFLHVGSGSHGTQTAKVLERLEPILIRRKPERVIVHGDTNTTLAGALTAAKLGIPVAHVEAGCRSFNWEMPEELNRVMVDHISDLHFAPDREATRHLRAEGIARRSIHEVGNTGLEAARRLMKLAGLERLRKFKVEPEGYVLATLHRAENTDAQKRFAGLVEAINRVAAHVPLLFPIHPRTAVALKRNGLRLDKGVHALGPLGALDFSCLLQHSLFVLSDSGGVQEEAAVVNRPCLILRRETEWQRLVDAGKNFIVGVDPAGIESSAKKLLRSPALRSRIKRRKAPLKFGATRRIIQVLKAE